jgi:hypothetical protein
MALYTWRWLGRLWWIVALIAFLTILGIETDWGRAIFPLPSLPPRIDPKAVAVALLPDYQVEGGLGARTETINRTLFNPTRRPAPPQLVDATRTTMQKGKYVLTGIAVAGDRHIAFLKETASGKSRVVRQGEQLNGALVATVGPDRVHFTQGDDSEDLVLKTAAGPRTTAVPAPPQPGVVPPEGIPGSFGPPPPSVPPPVPVSPPPGVPPARPPGAVVQPAVPGGQAAVPGAATSPAAADASSRANSTAASPDPAWNETFERMRQPRR